MLWILDKISASIIGTDRSSRLQVRRLDEIYHSTVDRVVRSLAALPEVTKQHSALAQLLSNLQIEKVGQFWDISLCIDYDCAGE